jgi:hypothetical protein
MDGQLLVQERRDDLARVSLLGNHWRDLKGHAEIAVAAEHPFLR